MADFTALRGIVCPVVSPCTSNEGVDYDSLQENLARLLRAPITGFYVCGGTGDGSRLTFAERCRTAELTIAQTGLLYGADGSIGTWINLLPEFYCKLWTLAQAGRCTELNRLQTAYTEFLRKGWQFGILNAFQELMRSLGYAEKCFRAPAVWQPGSMPEPLLQELLADLDGLNALAASMS